MTPKAAPAPWRNRIVGTGEEAPDQLVANPANWRMHPGPQRDALRGGMPLYKFVGNRLLTWFQNRALGSRLSEFHTGYKAYAVAALRRIPFDLNSNVFHFDTEIIIQLLRARCRIAEVPIPTHYGAEVCRVNGVRYAWDVVVASAVARLMNYGLVYRRNFDFAALTPANWKPALSITVKPSI